MIKVVLFHLFFRQYIPKYKADRVTKRSLNFSATNLRRFTAYTAVSTKVVQKTRKSVRDNAERPKMSWKYPINFNKSSESIARHLKSLKSSLYGRGIMDSELLLKFIAYFPDYLSAFFWTTFVETAVSTLPPQRRSNTRLATGPGWVGWVGECFESRSYCSRRP